MKIRFYYLLLYILTINKILAQPNDLSQPWEIDSNFIFLDQLENVIINDVETLPNIAGLLISKDGKIILENYYNNSNEYEIYQIASITKSFLSTIVGQAYDMELIPDPVLPLSNFLDEDIEYLDDITLEHLLTMTSGYAPLDNYLYASTYDLASAPSLSDPGLFYYQDPACHLISHVIYQNTGLTPYYFAEANLFPYLGINDPFWEYGWGYINDGGNGLWLNLKDMAKLGQLYLQDGYSGENQILSSDWIEKATSSAVTTGLDPLSGYGYLFWIPDVQNDYFEGSFFMMGLGGQNIFLSPRHNLLIATHSYFYPGNIYEHSDNLFLNIWNNVFPIFKLGDLNNDTIINVFDIIELSDMVLDSVDNNPTGDINNDDVLDDLDTQMLAHAILGL